MRSLVLAIVLFAVAHGVARAEDGHLPPLLSWRAPAGCGDELAVRRRIGELALSDAETRDPPFAIAEIASDASGQTARITLKTPDGITTRTRHAASCDELAEAVAQLVAMAWRTSVRGPKLVEWHAPDDCPDRLEVRARIFDRARGRVEATVPSATVEVRTDAGGYQAIVQIVSGQTSETREVRSATCAEVADAVAWMVAMAWAPRPTAMTSAVARAVPPARPSPWHLHAAVRSAFDAGSLPGPDAGLGLAAGVVHDRGFDAELAGTLWAKRFDELMDGSQAGVDVSLAAVSLQGCVSRWYACAGVEAGTIRARGIELQDGRSASLLWLAATAGARVRHPVTRTMRVVFDAGVVVPLARPEFTFDGGQVVFHSAPLGARLGVALEFAPFE